MQICCFLLPWLQLPGSELWFVQKTSEFPQIKPHPCNLVEVFATAVAARKLASTHRVRAARGREVGEMRSWSGKM